MNVTEIDPVEFGRQIGEIIRETIAPLIERIEQLEGDIKVLTELIADVEGRA